MPATETTRQQRAIKRDMTIVTYERRKRGPTTDGGEDGDGVATTGYRSHRVESSPSRIARGRGYGSGRVATSHQLRAVICATAAQRWRPQANRGLLSPQTRPLPLSVVDANRRYRPAMRSRRRPARSLSGESQPLGGKERRMVDSLIDALIVCGATRVSWRLRRISAARLN